MPPSLARELSVVYDATTIGGSSTSNLLTDWVTWNIEADRATVDCTFVLRSPARTEAEFSTLLAAVVTALRTPRKRLRIINGAVTLHDFNPATASGFNQMPSIEAEGAPGYDSAFTQRVKCHWEIDHPADTYGNAGRRTSSVSIHYDASRRRTVTITGEYRALPGTSISGMAVYTGAATAFCTTQLGLLGGSWDLIDEEPTKDDDDRIVGFTRTFHEIIYAEGDGGTDISEIQDAKLHVVVHTEFPGDSPGATVDRLQRASVRYSANVDYTETTALVSLYLATIRPRILASVSVQTGAAAVVVTREAPDYGLDGNTIDVQMELSLFGAGSVLSFTERCVINESPHHALQKAWKTRYSRYVYPIHVNRTRTTNRLWTRVGLVIDIPASTRPFGGLSKPDAALTGDAEAGLFGAPRAVVPTSGEAGQWIPQPEQCALAPRRIGSPTDATSVIVTDIMWQLIEDWAEPIAASILAQGRSLVV